MHAAFEEQLNRSLLRFDVNETIDMLINFNDSLTGGASGQQGSAGRAIIANDVDELIENLHSLENLIPNIVNQVVSALDIRKAYTHTCSHVHMGAVIYHARIADYAIGTCMHYNL